MEENNLIWSESKNCFLLNNTIDKKDYKEQLSIFDSNHDKTNEDNDLDVILDDINKKFEKPIVTKASKIKNKSIQKKYLK